MGTFNIHTGISDILKIGELKQWNFQNRTNLYDDECDFIKGSGGDFFPGHLTKTQRLSMFSPEMCRPVFMDYEEELDIHGVKTYRFAGGERTLDNGTENNLIFYHFARILKLFQERYTQKTFAIVVVNVLRQE